MYQPFVASSYTGNSIVIPWGIPNHLSAQGVETKETRQHVVNVDNAEDQEPEYRVPPINFHILAQPTQ